VLEFLSRWSGSLLGFTGDWEGVSLVRGFCVIVWEVDCDCAL
jgi:hypothetical protein